MKKLNIAIALLAVLACGVWFLIGYFVIGK